MIDDILEKWVQTYADSYLHTYNNPGIFVADFTERSNKERGVEVSVVHPSVPNSDKEMDCFFINNNNLLTIAFCVFDDNQFKDENGCDITHCECCFTPKSNDTSKPWTAFLEIKDCKIRNVSLYSSKAKAQVINTVEQFRQKGLLNGGRVYGIISIPRRKTEFDETIFTDVFEYKQLFKKTRIHFIATNRIEIENTDRVKNGVS